jgi:hypothetical protein
MTLTFHLYHDGIEVAEPPITNTELQQYRRDSKRSLDDRKQRISDAIHREYEAMRNAKPVQLVHLLLIAATFSLFVAQAHA